MTFHMLIVLFLSQYQIYICILCFSIFSFTLWTYLLLFSTPPSFNFSSAEIFHWLLYLAHFVDTELTLHVFASVTTSKQTVWQPWSSHCSPLPLCSLCVYVQPPYYSRSVLSLFWWMLCSFLWGVFTFWSILTPLKTVWVIVNASLCNR